MWFTQPTKIETYFSYTLEAKLEKSKLTIKLGLGKSVEFFLLESVKALIR